MAKVKDAVETWVADKFKVGFPEPPAARIGTMEWKPDKATGDRIKQEVDRVMADQLIATMQEVHQGRLRIVRPRPLPIVLGLLGFGIWLKELLPIIRTISPLDFFQLTAVVGFPTLLLVLITSHLRT